MKLQSELKYNLQKKLFLLFCEFFISLFFCIPLHSIVQRQFFNAINFNSSSWFLALLHRRAEKIWFNFEAERLFQQFMLSNNKKKVKTIACICNIFFTFVGSTQYLTKYLLIYAQRLLKYGKLNFFSSCCFEWGSAPLWGINLYGTVIYFEMPVGVKKSFHYLP